MVRLIPSLEHRQDLNPQFPPSPPERADGYWSDSQRVPAFRDIWSQVLEAAQQKRTPNLPDWWEGWLFQLLDCTPLVDDRRDVPSPNQNEGGAPHGDRPRTGDGLPQEQPLAPSGSQEDTDRGVMADLPQRGTSTRPRADPILGAPTTPEGSTEEDQAYMAPSFSNSPLPPEGESEEQRQSRDRGETPLPRPQ